MKNLTPLFCLFLLPAIFTGCGQKERVVNGQVFIVTQDAQNIKLALVDVFLLDESSATNWATEIRKSAESQTALLRSKIENANDKLKGTNNYLLDYVRTNFTTTPEYLSDLELAKQDQDHITQIEDGLRYLQEHGVSESRQEEYAKKAQPWIDALKSFSDSKDYKTEEFSEEVNRVKEEIKSLQSFIQEREHDLEYFSPVAFSLAESGVPLSTKSKGTSDADGKFVLKISSGGHFAILAQSKRQVGSTLETYTWFCWLPNNDPKEIIFLNNNNLSTVNGAHNVLQMTAR